MSSAEMSQPTSVTRAIMAMAIGNIGHCGPFGYFWDLSKDVLEDSQQMAKEGPQHTTSSHHHTQFLGFSCCLNLFESMTDVAWTIFSFTPKRLPSVCKMKSSHVSTPFSGLSIVWVDLFLVSGNWVALSIPVFLLVSFKKSRCVYLR